MPPDLKAMFPRASKDFLAANEQAAGPPPAENVIDHPLHVSKIHAPKGPNKTESEYGRILEGQKNRGEILRYEYEGITLRWADMKYTPDYVVFRNEWCDEPAKEGYPISFIEVKGGHIWDRDIVRFKGARAYWVELFDFEMWQKKDGQWTRLF